MQELNAFLIRQTEPVIENVFGLKFGIVLHQEVRRHAAGRLPAQTLDKITLGEIASDPCLDRNIEPPGDPLADRLAKLDQSLTALLFTDSVDEQNTDFVLARSLPSSLARRVEYLPAWG